MRRTTSGEVLGPYVVVVLAREEEMVSCFGRCVAKGAANRNGETP